MLSNTYEYLGHENRENLGATAPGWNRVKVHGNLGVTAVKQVTPGPVDTFLNILFLIFMESLVSMAQRSRAYVYDCCGATKTTLCSNLLRT